MSRGYYYLVAVGLVFVAFDFTINGIELLLPSTFGYAMIAIAANALRDDDRWYGFGIPLAAVLAVLSFPDLFSGAVGPSPGLRAWAKWTYYPYCVLHMILCVVLALTLMRRAEHRSRPTIRLAALFLAVLTMVVEGFRFAQPAGSWTLFGAVLIYILLIAGLYFISARRLT